MPKTDDIQLLREFAERQSEAAFSELARRHVNLVYSVALRLTGNSHHAEEITQAVFIILARKAGSLGRKTILSGWLYQTARLTAANFLRTERRRAFREQEAYMQSLSNEPGPDVWPQIAPLLDDAMAKLGEKDRDAVILRFIEGKSLHEVGAAMGASEDAAKMRVNRALEKLRKIFTKRGVTLTATLIAGALATNSAQPAPVGLAVTVAATAAKNAALGVSTLTLVKGVLKIMSWTKAKTAIVIGVGLVLATTATKVALSHDEQGDNDYAAAGVQAFMQQLRNNAPIKLLRFSEIVAGDTRGPRQFIAAVDGDDFFLREYQLGENPSALISTNNWLKNERFNGRYYGRYRDLCWSIDGPYITKSSVSDPVVNWLQLHVKMLARETIDSVLNMGVSGYEVKRGSFVCNTTNASRFTFELAPNVTATIDGSVVTNVSGRMSVKAGLVRKLKMSGTPIIYEYTTNSLVPFGIPTKMTVGTRLFGLIGDQRVFHIEELVYWRADNPQIAFSPESKYDSPDIPRTLTITNGQEVITQEGFKISPPLRPRK
ncbi:MAG: sigma-70 family RNA polymerase sigma factor [Pedosphaera sp.]|nr:sigma-70 family RNA polymerase sigma factor [Pedosphaera sp.]